jgi:hypothetical protein
MLTTNAGSFIQRAHGDALLAGAVQSQDCYDALANLSERAGAPAAPGQLRAAFTARSAGVLAPRMMRSGLIDSAPLPPITPLDTELWSRAAALDLRPIAEQLVSFQGWSPERAAAAERRYRRFLYLKATMPDGHASPTDEVDLFWHQHIINTQRYGPDCQFLAGRFLHHTFLESDAPDPAGRLSAVWVATWVCYETLFEEPYQETIGAALLRRWPAKRASS